MKVHRQVRPTAWSKAARIVSCLVEAGVKGSVRKSRSDVLLRLQLIRHHVDRSAEIRRADRGRGSRAPIEHGLSNELAREEGPRMVCGCVRVVEWNAVKRHGVVAVLETAKERLAVAKTRAVGRKTECAGRHLNDFGVIGIRRREVLDIFRADHGLRGPRVERTL